VTCQLKVPPPSELSDNDVSGLDSVTKVQPTLVTGRGPTNVRTVCEPRMAWHISGPRAGLKPLKRFSSPSKTCNAELTSEVCTFGWTSLANRG